MTHSAQSAAASATPAKTSSTRKTKQVKSTKSTPSPPRRSSRAASRDASAIGRIQLDNLEASDFDVLGSASGETQVVDAKSTLQSNSATSTTELSPSDDSSDSEANIPLSSRRKRSLTEVQKCKMLQDLFQSGDESEAEKDGSPASSVTQASFPPSSPSGPLSTPVAKLAAPPSTSAGAPLPMVSPALASAAKAKRQRPSSPRVIIKKPRSGAKSSVSLRRRLVHRPTAGKAVVTPKSTKKGKLAKSQSQLSSTSSSAVNSAPILSSAPPPSSNPAGSTTATGQLPDLLALPIAQLRSRAAQAATRDSRVSHQMKMWRSPPFFHSGAQRC
ncbi:hypothetical protein PHYPSEUDO_005162 [Phytophthora pseudosyringae]|uniref:Uncharacterized protein n=1 Tax=Phytophthora pseudosyringae TaxID=221518 RepID=A0A8T1VLP3_9STRA|nr:hypothetical protein PHYPSEUDO_005162 [Phytophthora pseudosyringae]